LATEDLLEREQYLNAVNGVLKDSRSDKRVTITDLAADLREGVPIAKAVENYLGEDACPGKSAVAGRLLRDPGLSVTKDARKALETLHTRFTELFDGHP